jgi:hypothetical protein
MAPKRRRANGEGAVYRRPSDGLWVGMLDLGIVGGAVAERPYTARLNARHSRNSAHSG